MVRNRAWLLAVLPIAACGRFGLDAAPGADGGTSVPDASVTADAGADDAREDGSAKVEASADASIDACAVFDDDFSTPPNGWTPLGDARLEGGKALLVPAVNAKRGAIWRSLQPTRTSLHVTFRFHIDPPDDVASDGLAFAWVDSESQPVLGGDAQNLGLCGKLNGFAIVVNSRDATYEIRDLQNGCGDIRATKQLSGVTGDHMADLLIREKDVRLTIEGVTVTNTVPRTTTIRWLGFGGGTGGFNAMHSVDDLSVSACVP